MTPLLPKLDPAEHPAEHKAPGWRFQENVSE
jgi:hypothetical protein